MDIYQAITDRIVDKLERGVVPWRKPWRSVGVPHNLVSKKPYRGINVFLLACDGYESPYWLSFKQASKLGGHVRKGERATMVVYWNWIEKQNGQTNADGKPIVDRIPFLRYYNVFNANQCDLPDGIVPEEKDRPEVEPISACDTVVKEMPNRPEILHNGYNRAFYRQGTDSIHMPERDRFEKQSEYYSTLFHELTHSTGHKSRLNRSTLTDYDGFGGQNYSREELVAEMGAAFLCGTTGIETNTLDNSASYIASWLRAFTDDKRMVVTAAAQAQKATDYILAKEYPADQ